MIFADTDIGAAFGVELISSDAMERALSKWDATFRGRPSWVKPKDDIESINMAKHIADTRARLTMLDIGISLSGSARADYLQTLTDKLLAKLPEKLADANGLGGLLFRWNGKSWDFILPGDFGITSVDDDGNINGVILANHIEQNGAHYTRLEYHRFEGDSYLVTNKAFKNQVAGDGKARLGREVPLTAVKEWADMAREATILNLDGPMFGYFRVPGSNTVDRRSPLGLSVFANAMHELKAIDIAVSRKDAEVEDSKHITFVGMQIVRSATQQGVELPRFVRAMGMGMGDDDMKKSVHEHVPTMLTEERIKDINFNLSMAGVKCGFSEGVFVLDGQTGMITATQIESDDRDTIQTIKADRDALQNAIIQALKGADAIATLYGAAPLGEYEADFSFGDLTYSYEEDKQTWWKYVQQGYMPEWLYFVKFEKMSEEEAKALVQEAKAAQQSEGIFDHLK